MSQSTPVKPILITGATRGLGAAFAQCLAHRAPIIAVGRTVGALEELDDLTQKSDAPYPLTLAPLDITDDGAMQHLCANLHDRWGGISAWIHTAIHAAPLTPAHHIQNKDFQTSVDVNIMATARLIRYVAPLLMGTGRALFIEDCVSGKPFYGTYGATKSAQIDLARSWQAETKNIGPMVTILPAKPMSTATRGRFHPGEDRTPLSTPKQEAQRLLKLWDRV